MQVLSRQRGVSLIEVLMAVLIFSIGLIGMAALMVMATRSNQTAYLRTQVTFLAHNMADRMRANPIGVWDGDYNATFPSTVTQDCAGATCTPAQLAAYDQQMWNSQLTTFLPPGFKASVTCSNGGAGYVPTATQIAMRPPFGGTCNMEIEWAERGVAGSSNNQASSEQTFAWEFQP